MMHSKILGRYFATLLIPSVVILLLSLALTLYTHSQGMKAIQQDIEKSSQRVTESISDNIDTLLEQIRMNSSNLSIQMYKGASSSAFPHAMYRNTIDQMAYLQLNAESLLNPIVNRGYILLFDEDRVISQSSTLNNASQFYQNYFRFLMMDYTEAKEYLSSSYYSGTIFPDVEIGYLDETYHAWVVAQSIPADPMQKPVGVILFILDPTALIQRLSDGLADEDSLCLMMDAQGNRIVSQGSSNSWNDQKIAELLALLPPDAQESHYITMEDRTEYLVNAAQGGTLKILTAQPRENALGMAYTFHRRIILLTADIMVLAIIIVMVFTHRNVSSAQNVINTVAPRNQSGSATSVFQYMQEGIRSSQENEDILHEHADQQRGLIQTTFLKRLMRGEFLMESELVREQINAGIELESACFTVLLVRLKNAKASEGRPVEIVREIFLSEFGHGNVLAAEMNVEAIACLLLSEDADMHDSIESAAELLNERLSTTCFAGNTVFKTMDIPNSYREARNMSKLTADAGSCLYWYSELFQDDALYNSEYSLFSETKLSNNIAAGNTQATQEILDTIYQHSIQTSGRSAHMLRFATYDLYRLVNHIGAGDDAGGRADFLARLQDRMDSVLENPQKFDSYFDEIKSYCLSICEKKRTEHRCNHDGLLRQVLEYIEAHFMNADVTVGSIADALNISDKYLSQFFKEQTNEKISSYIENKRIDHACHLLDTTNLSVNEIASASGYALTHTFRVAFKKIHGVTPLQWKAAHRE